MSSEELAIFCAAIGVAGTLIGTLLGWGLQFIKKRKLVISEIVIKPVKNGSMKYACFDLNVFNTSNQSKAMRNLKIIARDKKVQIFEEDVQFTKLYKNHQEMEENEVYVNNIELLEIPAFKSINQKCKIDLFDIWDLDINVTSVYLIYKDECFKSKRKILKWDSSAYAKLRENKNGTKD